MSGPKIQSSHERSPDHPQLPTPRRIVVSPLPKHESGNNNRMKRKWSPLEEQTLRDAVNKHGRGNWTFILNKNRDVFLNRTAGDLKDKWWNIQDRLVPDLCLCEVTVLQHRDSLLELGALGKQMTLFYM